MKNTKKILNEIYQERKRQHSLFGQQDHPNGTGGHSREAISSIDRDACEEAFKIGQGTWLHILREEVSEAFAEHHPDKLREELVQCAAVCLSWIEAIDRSEK